MADFLIINSNIALTKTPESAFSVMKTLAADFDGAVTNALNVRIPITSKILNKGLIGKGDEWASRADPDYAEHTGMTFSDRVNTDQFARLAARTLSGDITSTEVTPGSGVYDHVVEMKRSNLDPQLKSSSVAFELGGYDLILAGMVGNSLSVSVQGGNAPQGQVELIGGGLHEFMADQTPALVLPDPVDMNYVGQRSQSTFEFNDGTVFDVTGVGRLDSFNLNFSNNLVTNERRIGDPLVDAASDNSGAHVRQLTRGDERTLTLSAGIYVAADKRGYLAHLNNTEITNLKLKSVGNRKIAATSYYHEVEVIVPKATIISAEMGGDRKGIVTFNFEPLFNPAGSEDGPFKMRFRNGTATLA